LSLGAVVEAEDLLSASTSSLPIIAAINKAVQ
jgi:hypothetical protein